MADDPGQPSAPSLRFADTADVDRFVSTLERYERGDLDADGWRQFRLLHGVYMQRQKDEMMLRAKLPHGVVSAAQLRALADVGRHFSKGRAHVTTRQNVQFYFLPVRVATDAMARLAEVGITTREACGHSVRTVTTSPLAGVDADEVFDVTPYAEALTRHFLRGPRSASLPRKFKIGVEGGITDSIHASINDLSFFARRDEAGRPGFRILVGGGTSTLARSGFELTPFVPVEDFLGLAEAVVRVYHREGERENKAKARIKWLAKKVGWPQLQRWILEAWDELRAEGAPALPFDPATVPVCTPPELPAIPGGRGGAAFEAWRVTNVRPQKHAGRVVASVTLRLGDLMPAQLEGLADLAERFSDGTMRTTVEQNLLFRHVREDSLAALFDALAALELALPGAGTLADVTSCAGAHTCALAVTASRGLGFQLIDDLRKDARTFSGDARLEGAEIKVSGCPNGCGQHHIASISLQGAMRRLGGRPIPLYQLAVGGGASPTGEARFARLVGKLPARRVTAAIARIVADFEAAPLAPTLHAHLALVEVERVRRVIGELFDIDEASATPDDYVDVGQSEPFAALGDLE